MLPTFSARAHFTQEAIDRAYILDAAHQTGGQATVTDGCIVEGGGFSTMRKVEQFCARVCMKYPTLKFEITRPQLRKKKEG